MFRTHKAYIQHLFSIVLIVLIASQVVTVSAVPDHTAESREYLTHGEVDGKIWAANHITETVYSDYSYTREVVRPTVTGQPYSPGPVTPAEGFRHIEPIFLSGTIEESDHQYILFRPENELYQAGGYWKLTYDPESVLKANRNQIYSNNEAKIYKKRM